MFRNALLPLLLTCLFAVACASLSPENRGRAVLGNPESASMTVENIVQQPQTFTPFYSGPNPARPAALLFIPRDTMSLWNLPTGYPDWRQVETSAGTKEILRRLKSDDALRQLRLRTLYAPQSLAPAGEPVGFLYAIEARVPLRDTRDPKALTLHPIRDPLRKIIEPRRGLFN